MSFGASGVDVREGVDVCGTGGVRVLSTAGATASGLGSAGVGGIRGGSGCATGAVGVDEEIVTD
ncbi:hypothetical protein HK104_001624, partial [Borealophlyctis nickersoniae]